jgi:hypothetical protein
VVGGLLESKYRVPTRRPNAVARPRLAERLSAASQSALTVLSAPAGFGKTTALTEWLATVPAEASFIAWLSLDHRDNDPALFWTYVVTTMQTATDGVGEGASQMLASSSPPGLTPPTPRPSQGWQASGSSPTSSAAASPSATSAAPRGNSVTPCATTSGPWTWQA